jgi:hypothetical protein
MSGRAPLWVIMLLCVVAAAFIGWVDFHQSEVQPAVFLLLVCGAGIAWLRPRGAWLVALMLGLSIIVTHFVAVALGITQRVPPASPITTLVALIPAAIGAAVGAALGIATTSASRRQA